MDSASTLHFRAQPIVSKIDLNSLSLTVILYKNTLFCVATNRCVCLPVALIARPVIDRLTSFRTFILFFLSRVKSPLKMENLNIEKNIFLFSLYIILQYQIYNEIINIY